jgi:glycogen synthase
VALHAEPARFKTAQIRGMQRDFSWLTAARAYERLYNDTI